MAFFFKEARLSTTTGSYIEHNKFCGQISTIMKKISNFLDRLLKLPPQIRSTPHQMLKDNHTDTDANRGEIKDF